MILKMSTKNYNQWGAIGSQLVGLSQLSEAELKKEQRARIERQMKEISTSLAKLVKHISGHMPPTIQPQK